MRRDGHTPWQKAAGVILATVLVVAPATAIAGDRFTDVPETNTFHDDIAWLAEAGITKGCNPPTNDEYCPDENVTRGQMAAFLRRLAEGEIVAADTAVTAGDADTVDGLHAADLQVHVDGLSRDSGGGATSITFGVGDSRAALLEKTLDADHGELALVTYSAWMADLSSSSNVLALWLQIDEATCDPTAIAPGSFILESVSADGVATLSSSLAVSAAGDPTVTLCASTTGGEAAAFDVALNTVQSDSGAVEVTAGG